MDVILSLVYKASLYSPFFGLLISIRAYKNFMWYYLLCGGLAELLGGYLKHRFEWHYEFVANAYISLEIVFYMTFFYYHLFRKRYRFALIAVVVLWEGMFWFDTFNTPILRMNDAALGLNCLIYAFLAMLTYREILIRQEYEKLWSSPVFWINTGIFLCASGGCLFFLLLERVLAEDTQFLITLWTTFYCIINMLRYAFIGIGLNRLARNERI